MESKKADSKPPALPLAPRLPADVLRVVVRYTSRLTKSVLMRTSKQMYQITGPILYYRVPFKAYKGRSSLFDGLLAHKPVQPSWTKKIPPPNRKKELLKHIKVIDIHKHHHDSLFGWKTDFARLDYALPNLQTVVVWDRCRERNSLCPALFFSGATPETVCFQSLRDRLPPYLISSKNKNTQIVFGQCLAESYNPDVYFARGLVYPLDASCVTLLLDETSTVDDYDHLVWPALGNLPCQVVGLMSCPESSRFGHCNDVGGDSKAQMGEWYLRHLSDVAYDLAGFEMEDLGECKKKVTFKGLEEWRDQHKGPDFLSEQWDQYS